MTDSDALVSDYLRRLELAAGGLPAERRTELIEEISAHITEARAQIPASIAGPESDLLDLLNRLGDPEEIALAAADVPALVAATSGPAESGPGARAAAGVAAWPIEPRQAARSAAPAGQAWGPALGSPEVAGSGAEGHEAAGDGTDGEPGQAPARPGTLEIVAVCLTIGSVFLLPILHLAAAVLWLAGVILLWYSPRWRVSDKVLGTIVWPAGIGLAVLLARLPAFGAHLFIPFGLRYGGFYGGIRLTELAAAIAAVVIVTVRLLRQASRAVA